MLAGDRASNQCRRYESVLSDLVKDRIPQYRGIPEQDGDGEQQSEKMNIVVPANTIIDPDTVMVLSLYANLADATMLAAGWFGEFACVALHVRMVEYIVIRVGRQTLGVVWVCDGG